MAQRLSFPSDHYFHSSKHLLEWWYFWGKLENKFFHYAEFFTNIGGAKVQTIHYSLNNEFYDEIKKWDEDISSHSGYMIDSFSFTTPILSTNLRPLCEPVVHSSKLNRTYYSIPLLQGYGHIKEKKFPIQAWFDHECNNIEITKTILWDWVGLKLDCGINIMAYASELERIADINLGDRTLSSSFILEGKHLFLNDLAMYLILEPSQDEVIFEPRLGVRYSEQPFDIISKGNIIGYGMRERTYHKEVKNAI